MRNVLFALTLLSALCLAGGAAAQSHPNVERGFPVSGSFEVGGPDAINAYNGHLTIALPLGRRYPVGGALSYDISLVYTGQLWDFSDRRAALDQWYVVGKTAKSSNAGLGWRVSFGEMIPPNSTRTGAPNWVYEGPDGTQHVFYTRLHDVDPAYSGVLYTRDGSYLRMQQRYDATLGTVYDVEFPDGTVHRFDSGGSIVSMRDVFGNYANFTRQFSIWCPSGGMGCGGTETLTLTDQHGRSVKVYYAWDENLAENRWVDKVEVAGFGNTVALYDFEQSFTTVQRTCDDTDPETPDTTPAALLTRVVQPDGTAFEMPMYETTGTCSSAMIQQLRLPTRGIIEWDYQEWKFTNPDTENNRWASRTTGVAHRRLITPGDPVVPTWTYTTSLVRDCSTCVPPRELVNTITDPAGNQKKHYFAQYIWTDTRPNSQGWRIEDYSLPFTRNVTDATGTRYLSTILTGADGLEVERRYVRYEQDPGNEAGPRGVYDHNSRVLSERTVYTSDGGRYKDVTHSRFDGLGHYRQTVTGGNFDAYNVRQTTREFNPGTGTYQLDSTGYNVLPGFTMLYPFTTAWVLDTYTESSATADGVTEKRQYCFDAATGTLLRDRTMAGLNPGTTDLLRVYSYTGGNLTTERRFGGDNQAVGTGDLCTMALPTSDQLRIVSSWLYGGLRSVRYHTSSGTALTHYNVDNDIDFNTAMPSASRDSAGLTTTYVYDAFGRIRWAKPASGGWTESVYTAATVTTPAQVEIREWNQGATVVMGKSQTILDAFGRTVKERRLNPSGTWDTKTYRYNVRGLRDFVSETSSLDNPTAGTTLRLFDAYGRAGELVTADGAVTQYVYRGVRERDRITNVRTAGTATTFTNSQTKTTETYDRMGRLWRVTEPSGASGANVITQYSYDQAERLTRVNTAAAEGTQNRYFTYDRRGLLTSEQHPEKGFYGNGSVSYSMFDASGRALRRVDGSNDLRYTYDRADRLISVAEGSGRVWKTYTYATANGTGDYRKGKLWQALRHNYFDRFAMDITMTETYTYGGVGGRISRRDTVSSDVTAFTQTFTYDDRGRTTNLGYPTCTADCTLAGDNVSFNYTNGFLTSIPRFATNIAYHANGMVSDVTYNNGAHWVQTIDASGMARPRAIGTTVTSANWSSGEYKYDPAGNITAIGNDYYLYDLVGRVKRGTAQNGLASQTYTHDSFGNLTASGTRSLLTAASTNRLSGVNYDASGNVTQQDGYYYEYDPLGMMRATYDGSYTSRDWVYLYTADDERIWSYDIVANTSWWRVRDLDGKVLNEMVNVGDVWTAVTNYVYRDGLLLGSYSPNRLYTYNFFAVDHLGTPRQILNSSRSVLGNHAYFPFGDESTPASTDGEIMKFTGHERDFCCSGAAAYRLDYMHARHYAPNTGRFLSTDTAPARGHSPQTWNRYSYTANNPMKFTDPTGLYFVLANERDRKFFTSAIAKGSANRAAREVFLKLAADPRPITLQRGPAGGGTKGAPTPGRIEVLPNTAAQNPTSAGITIDTTQYSKPQAAPYWNPTVSTYHELWHAFDFFYLGGWAYKTFGDETTATSKSRFDMLGYEADTVADDPANQLTEDEVSSQLHTSDGNWTLVEIWGLDLYDFLHGNNVYIDGMYVGMGGNVRGEQGGK